MASTVCGWNTLRYQAATMRCPAGLGSYFELHQAKTETLGATSLLLLAQLSTIASMTTASVVDRSGDIDVEAV